MRPCPTSSSSRSSSSWERWLAACSGWSRRAAALVLLAALAGCIGTPRPFEHGGRIGETERQLLALPDTAGILVEPVQDLPEETSRLLGGALAEALAAANVPASTTAANRASYRLAGRAGWTQTSASQAKLLLYWQLFDRTGAAVGEHLQTEILGMDEWNAQAPDTFARFAANAAPAIAAMVQDEAAPDLAAAGPHRVAVLPVEGNARDESQALSRALGYFLEQAGYEVTGSLEDVTAVVLGSVEVGAARGGQRPIRIAWSVSEPAGAELGVVEQTNVVPEEAITVTWTETAYFIAEGAAAGIAAVLDQHPPQARPTPPP